MAHLVDVLGDPGLQFHEGLHGLARLALVPEDQLAHLLHLRERLPELVLLGQEGVGVALHLAGLLDLLRGQLADLGDLLGGGAQAAGVGQPRAHFLREQLLGDLPGAAGDLLAALFQLAPQPRGLLLEPRDLRLGGEQVRVERRAGLRLRDALLGERGLEGVDLLGVVAALGRQFPLARAQHPLELLLQLLGRAVLLLLVGLVPRGRRRFGPDLHEQVVERLSVRGGLDGLARLGALREDLGGHRILLPFRRGGADQAEEGDSRTAQDRDGLLDVREEGFLGGDGGEAGPRQVLDHVRRVRREVADARLQQPLRVVEELVLVVPAAFEPLREGE